MDFIEPWPLLRVISLEWKRSFSLIFFHTNIFDLSVSSENCPLVSLSLWQIQSCCVVIHFKAVACNILNVRHLMVLCLSFYFTHSWFSLIFCVFFMWQYVTRTPLDWTHLCDDIGQCLNHTRSETISGLITDWRPVSSKHSLVAASRCEDLMLYCESQKSSCVRSKGGGLTCFGRPVGGQEEDKWRPETSWSLCDNEDDAETTSVYPSTEQAAPGLCCQSEWPFTVLFVWFLI